jgi:hypothetical protein
MSLSKRRGKRARRGAQKLERGGTLLAELAGKDCGIIYNGIESELAAMPNPIRRKAPHI